MSGKLIFSQPISPPNFTGRKSVVDQIVQRLESPGLLSTSLVGGPRTGKTTMLGYLASASAAGHFQKRPNLIRVLFDAQGLGKTGKPVQFWTSIFKQIKPQVGPGLAALLDSKLQRAAAEKLDYFDLEDVFDALAKANTPVALLVNAFDVLLQNPHFWPPDDFFHRVRSLGQRQPRGLAFVIATMRPLLDLWDPNRGASPFYNIFLTVPVGRIEEEDVREYVRRACKQANLGDRPDMEEIVLQASDCHPCLVACLTNFCVCGLSNGQPLATETIRTAMLDPDGVCITLYREIRAELSPMELDWLDRHQLAPAQLSETKAQSLRRLREYGLLPPGTKI